MRPTRQSCCLEAARPRQLRTTAARPPPTRARLTAAALRVGSAFRRAGAGGLRNRCGLNESMRSEGGTLAETPRIRPRQFKVGAECRWRCEQCEGWTRAGLALPPCAEWAPRPARAGFALPPQTRTSAAQSRTQRASARRPESCQTAAPPTAGPGRTPAQSSSGPGAPSAGLGVIQVSAGLRASPAGAAAGPSRPAWQRRRQLRPTGDRRSRTADSDNR